MFRGSGGITHVVQTIEESNQIVSAIYGIAFRTRYFKVDLIEETVAAGHMARILDGPAVIIESDEPRLRKRFRHQHRRCAVSAANVGNRGPLGKFVPDSVESRDPPAQEILLIVRPEESLRSKEQIGIVLVPANAIAGAESLGDLRLV